LKLAKALTLSLFHFTKLCYVLIRSLC